MELVECLVLAKSAKLARENDKLDTAHDQIAALVEKVVLAGDMLSNMRARCSELKPSLPQTAADANGECGPRHPCACDLIPGSWLIGLSNDGPVAERLVTEGRCAQEALHFSVPEEAGGSASASSSRARSAACTRTARPKRTPGSWPVATIA